MSQPLLEPATTRQPMLFGGPIYGPNQGLPALPQRQIGLPPIKELLANFDRGNNSNGHTESRNGSISSISSTPSTASSSPLFDHYTMAPPQPSPETDLESELEQLLELTRQAKRGINYVIKQDLDDGFARLQRIQVKFQQLMASKDQNSMEEQAVRALTTLNEPKRAMSCSCSSCAPSMPVLKPLQVEQPKLHPTQPTQPTQMQRQVQPQLQLRPLKSQPTTQQPLPYHLNIHQPPNCNSLDHRLSLPTFATKRAVAPKEVVKRRKTPSFSACSCVDKKCYHCKSKDTPEWRRGPDGDRTLCNACGLFYAKLCKKYGQEKARDVMMDRRQKGQEADRRVSL